MAPAQKYLLQDLLNVRLLREDTAAKQWAVQKELVAKVERQLEKRRSELETYQRWRVQREVELYQQILEKKIHPKDLEALRFRIQKLRDEEHEYESRTLDTANQLQEEQARLATAKESYLNAYQQRSKLDEHKDLWVQEMQREKQFLEEKEIEDHRVIASPLFAEVV